MTCAGLWQFIEGSRGYATNEREPLLADAQKETEMIIFEAAGELLKKTNTDPSEVQEFLHTYPVSAEVPDAETKM